jgi:hypothetical protein
MYSQETRQSVIYKLMVEGKTYGQARRELSRFDNVPCERTMRRWLRRYTCVGDLEARLRPGKFAKKWEPHHLHALLALIDSGGEQITHAKLASVCDAWFGITLHVGGESSRLLRKLNMTRKRVIFLSPRKDPIAEFDYKMGLVNKGYRMEQLVFNDESYVNKHTLNMCYGYSRRGMRCRAKSHLASTRRRAILGSISTRGLVGRAGIYHAGSTNTDVFLHYLANKLLPFMNPFYDVHGAPTGLPDSVLVLDGASYHRSQEVRDMLANARVEVEFLPPYSPEVSSELARAERSCCPSPPPPIPLSLLETNVPAACTPQIGPRRGLTRVSNRVGS